MKTIGLVLMTLFSIGCNKSVNSLENYQNVFFEFSYSNSAWDKSHSGWFVDKLGRIKTYNNPSKWIFPDLNGFISGKDMESNLAQTVDAKISIDKSEFYSKIDLINHISRDSINTPLQKGADMGQMAYICYQFDEKNNRYKEIPLSIWGDFEQTNTQTQSKLLLVWLKQIQQKMLE